jgi:hypothetical protein
VNAQNYIDHYDKEINQRKLALLRALSAWWITTTNNPKDMLQKSKKSAREKVKVQLAAMRAYLDELEQEIDKEITS